MTIKETPLASIHRALGAKMQPFAGYDMPILYSSIKEEHQAVRNAAGLFDVSHMGEFEIKGPEAKQLLASITCNDVDALYSGRVQYSCLMNEQGGIVDDLLIYCFSETQYFLVVNASNIEKDFKWIDSHNSYDAVLSNQSEDYALLALQGPKAWDCLKDLVEGDLSEMPYYHFERVLFKDLGQILISTTGYTGSGGFEIYISNEQAPIVWEAIMKAGAECGLQAIGLGARDTLRLEMGFCLYGNDINNTTSPREAGLNWIVKSKKEFLGSDVLAEQKSKGVSRKLIGFEMMERGIARHDYVVVDSSGAEIGKVTSGSMTPSVEKSIGMAYVEKKHSKVGGEIFIQIRNKEIPAKIVRTPFYKTT